ncbi:PepSY domain-containing protein [Spirulina sp. 06S082]|uniref:PepSY domain-containing protein n=1 Tax=Spirulina sp. 06S082 TaxID=3110248 RepID=UPI002B1F6B1A|nr:PepSY domain-containing protein [Spirulina sp. 06S082]MEA5469322.1 PepSY domain-containing protein [Spirulina sp. 06S082]
MKKSLSLLSLGILSAIGLSSAVRGVYAHQNQRPIAHIPQSPDSILARDIEEEGEMNDDREEQQEEAQLQNLAKITPEQARQVAEAARGATATEVELDVEDGSLVYEVEFADAEVLVDAGNSQILKIEEKGQEEDDDTEMPVRGSIQVPDSDQDATEH